MSPSLHQDARPISCECRRRVQKVGHLSAVAEYLNPTQSSRQQGASEHGFCVDLVIVVQHAYRADQMSDHGGGKALQGSISDAVGIFLVPMVDGVFEGAEGKGFQRFDVKVVS